VAGEQRTRLCVIDDDTTFLNLMRELLEQARGDDVLICRAWQDAYHFVKHERPSLVILDIPAECEERGWSILELLTLDPETRPIPVIVLSGAIRGLHEHQPWLGRVGVCALPKPFDLPTLQEMIERVLGGPADAAL
jgi:CheY-like chemotaxis protein